MSDFNENHTIMVNSPQHQQDKIDHFQVIMAKNGYKIIQTKSQRIYTQSSPLIEPPLKGAEVFIGKLPLSLYDDELFTIFLKIGPIYMMRVMINLVGNRGFAFITYFSSENAKTAARLLNGYNITNNCNIIVYISLDNRCLFVGNLPKERSYEEIVKALKSYMKGIVNVIMYKEPSNLNLNRSFVFVEFETHGKAELTRRQFRGHLVLWGKLLSIDWANTVPVLNPTILAKITTLFMRNIPVEYSSQDLNFFLHTFLPFGYITKVCKTDHYAFVHFVDKKSAEEALVKLNGLAIKGNRIQVEWARPKKFSNKYLKAAKDINANA